eukprot:2576910-Amphidinium_carterae.1
MGGMVTSINLPTPLPYAAAVRADLACCQVVRCGIPPTRLFYCSVYRVLGKRHHALQPDA